MGRHIWSDEVKEQALALIADPELSYYDVKAATGVPGCVLWRWCEERSVDGRTQATWNAEMVAKADQVEARILELASRWGVKNLDVLSGLRGDGPIVYFVSCNGGALVKIGTSRKFPNRFAALKYYMPLPLTLEALLPGSFSTERMCHQGFAPDRLHGEWFSRSEYLDEFIGWVREEFGAPEALEMATA